MIDEVTTLPEANSLDLKMEMSFLGKSYFRGVYLPSDK